MKRFMFFAAVPILIGMALTAITHAQNWESTDGPWRADVRDLTAGRLSSSTQVTLYISDASSIYRSTNSAGSWSATASPGGNPLAITCKPDDPNVVLVGINFYLKRSTNGGGTWTNVINNDPNVNPLRLATSPASTVRMYAGLEKVAGQSSMRRSEDGGLTWVPVNYFFSGVQTDITALAPHPTDALKVWAGGTTPTVLEPPQNFQYTFTNGVFSSTDGGATWTNTGDLAKNVVALAAYTRSSTTYIFAGTTDGSNKLVKTTDGTNWSTVSSYTGGFVKDIATRDDGVYQTIFVAADNGVYISTNNGTSWSSSCAGIYNTTLDRVVVISEGSPTNTQLAFAGGDGSLFKSTNAGSTWTDVGKPASVPAKSFGTTAGKMNVRLKTGTGQHLPQR